MIFSIFVQKWNEGHWSWNILKNSVIFSLGKWKLALSLQQQVPNFEFDSADALHTNPLNKESVIKIIYTWDFFPLGCVFTVWLKLKAKVKRAVKKTKSQIRNK